MVNDVELVGRDVRPDRDDMAMAPGEYWRSRATSLGLGAVGPVRTRVTVGPIIEDR